MSDYEWLKKPTLDVTKAGEIAGLSRNAAYAAARTGEIPTIRIGRRVLVPTALFAEKLGLRAAFEKLTGGAAA